MTVTVDQLIAIVAVVFGGGTSTIVYLKHRGLVTFGKAPERRMELIHCPGHNAMHNDIKRLAKELACLKKTLHDISLQMAQHMGYHEGTKDES
jgi:hypothetical protein